MLSEQVVNIETKEANSFVEEEASLIPKLAFAGVGWIGRLRMKAAVDAKIANVTLLSDPSEECLSEAQKMAPAAEVITSFEDIFTNNDIDAVVIATPSALHKEQAVKAFENSKAVFCQKPLGRNSEEVKAVIDAAKRANKLLGADFSYRYTAAFQKIFPIIQSGELGKIFAVDLKFHNAYGPDKPWFYDIKLSGGGCVLDLGIHLIDLMLYALNFPEVKKVHSKLFTKGVLLKDQSEVEDYANVIMEVENDITAQLSCSWNLKAGQEAVIEASFYGTDGGVSLKNINGSFYNFTALRFWGTKTEVLTDAHDDWGGRALINWIKQLSKSTSFNPEAENYLKSAEVIDKIYARS